MTEDHNIGHALRTAMELSGNLRQVNLARAMGLRASSVSLWLSGRNRPDVENLSKLARILDVSFEWLATGRGPMRYESTSVGEQQTPSTLTAEQLELLALFSRLVPHKKKALIDFLKKIS